MRRIPWSKYGGKLCHAICHHLEPGVVQPMHCHEFPEVFWGVEGACEHQVNDEVHVFGEGDLYMLRPNDGHEMQVTAGKPFRYYLVGFPLSHLNQLRKKYFADNPDFWGGSDPMPKRMKLTTPQKKWLAAAFIDVLNNQHCRLTLDRFLINLVYEFRQEEADPFRSCPDWLQSAIRELRGKKENLFEGSGVLSRLSGRTPEHVSRLLKKHTGLTPSDVVNRARVEYAASLLAVSTMPILEVALDCGFSGLGRFYEVFKKHYGIPPRQYRLQHLRSIVAGVGSPTGISGKP